MWLFLPKKKAPDSAEAFLAVQSGPDCWKPSDNRGVSYLEAMDQADLAITDHSRLTPPNLAAMLEVHIEQGAVLEKRGRRIGLVKAIAGIRQLNITIGGTADHAGTTPMEDRFDPLQAAARVIIEIDQIARDASPNAVATVGRITCEPAQVNVIPGRVNFSVDVRDSNRKILQSAVSKMHQTVEKICAEKGLVFEIVELSEAEPVTLSTSIIKILEEKAKTMGVKPYSMISGAGHDTALIAPLTKAGMIFVPSRDGLSHCPQEYSRLDDIALGCDILLATATQLVS
jgi:hydantoinase/carbamoylase family amidase